MKAQPQSDAEATLERDLQRYAAQRLQAAIRDIKQAFEIAGVADIDALGCIMARLMFYSSVIAVHVGREFKETDEDARAGFLAVIAEMFDDEIKRRDKDDKREEIPQT